MSVIDDRRVALIVLMDACNHVHVLQHLAPDVYARLRAAVRGGVEAVFARCPTAPGADDENETVWIGPVPASDRTGG